MRRINFLAVAAVAIAGCSSFLPPSELKPLNGDATVTADGSALPCQTHTLYLDLDGDGYGDAAKPNETCSATVVGYVDNKLDCNDAAKTVHPGAPEACNKVDDDCNGQTDDTAAQEWWVDADHDGYGNPALKHLGACTSAEVWLVNNSSDCNDNDIAINPGMAEECNGVDDNCNGKTDEGKLALLYADVDGDGHGDLLKTVLACKPGANAVISHDDCDDSNKLIYPGAPELCDNLDNNCNGQTDEGKLTTFYKDSDGDGHGDLKQTLEACDVPVGATTTSDDCNDDPLKGGKAIFPGAVEVCNEIDDNCNGKTDEGVQLSFYFDNDGDGYAGAAQPLLACAAPTGFYSDKTDCNDLDPSIHPGAKEICDGKDNTCAGGQLLEPDSLCDDGTKYKKFTCGGAKGCSSEDEKLVLSCFNPPDYALADGYTCSVSYFFGDPTVAGQFDMTIGMDSVTLLLKDVCAKFKAGQLLRVNSYVQNWDPAAIWVGGSYTKLLDSFTNSAILGVPGNVTLSWQGLDFNFSNVEITACK